MTAPLIAPELQDARRAIRPAAIVSSIAGGALLVATAWALWTILRDFQTSRCPPESFLSAPTGTLFAMLPTFLALVAVCFLIGVVLSWRIAGEQTWRRWSVAEYGGQPNHFERFVRFFSIAGLVMTTIAAPVDYAFAHHEVCLTRNGLYVGSNWGSKLTRRSWRDVAIIRTSCRPGRGGWAPAVALRLNNGERVNLADAWMGWSFDTDGRQYRSWIRTIPMVWDAAHPFNGQFDSSDVRMDCPLSEVSWLARRP